MKEIIIYTKEICPFCAKAKQLFKNKGLVYKEIVLKDDASRDEMIKKSNGRMTIPQIFIGEYHVGGCDDLYALEESGKLNDLLK